MPESHPLHHFFCKFLYIFVSVFCGYQYFPIWGCAFPKRNDSKLDNAWQETTTRWGVATVALDRLARISDARIVVMGPVPVGVTDKIADNRIWQTLPAVQHTPPIYIPAVWSFGGLPSASRFARLIADALVNAHAKAPAPGAGWPNAAPEA